MAAGCLCGVPNTGNANCELQEGAPLGFFFVKLVADDGTLNSYTIATEFTDSVRDGLVQNTDTSKRWYPLTKNDFIRITPTEPASTSGDFGDVYYADKKISFNVELQVMKTSEHWATKLGKGLDCGEWGVYIVDTNNQLFGQISSDETKLYPKAISNGSVLAMYNPVNKGDNNPNKTLVRFSLSQINDGEDARILGGITTNLLQARGLVDTKGVFSSITSTGFTLTLSAVSSSAVKVPMSGLVQGDFVVKDKSDDSVITITGFSEATDTGIYVFTHAAQTGSFYVTPTKTGFDFRQVTAQTETY